MGTEAQIESCLLSGKISFNHLRHKIKPKRHMVIMMMEIKIIIKLMMFTLMTIAMLLLIIQLMVIVINLKMMIIK